MAGASTVTGTVASYAGGSITAIFQAQGGGSPPANNVQVSTTLDGSGVFSLTAWENTYSAYNPSVTTFLLQLGSTQFSVTTAINSTSQDISALFADAPAPPAAGGVPSVNGITDAVTIAAGTNVTVDTVSSTITINSEQTDFSEVETPSIFTGTASKTDLAGEITMSGGTGTYSYSGTYAHRPQGAIHNHTTPTDNPSFVVTNTTLTVTKGLTGGATDVIGYILIFQD